MHNIYLDLGREIDTALLMRLVQHNGERLELIKARESGDEPNGVQPVPTPATCKIDIRITFTSSQSFNSHIIIGLLFQPHIIPTINFLRVFLQQHDPETVTSNITQSTYSTYP